MAAPATMNILDITGVFVLNKTQSDSTEQILTLQGVGWLTRKAILYGTLTLYIKHYKDESGIEHIDIDQKLTGGIPGTREERVLTWTPKSHEDHIFGAVVGKSRRIKAEELDEEFLKRDWNAETIEHGVINSYVESDTAKSGTSWIVDQTWGFEEIEGATKYTRHLKFTGPKAEDIEARLVYDYYSPLSE